MKVSSSKARNLAISVHAAGVKENVFRPPGVCTFKLSGAHCRTLIPDQTKPMKSESKKAIQVLIIKVLQVIPVCRPDQNYSGNGT